MKSLGEHLSEGRPTTGFDWLRMVLALGVVGIHTLALADNASMTQVWSGPWRFLPAAILPMFFALSGFLVSSSLERNSIPRFLVLRVIRIVPALAVETVLVALGIGLSVTVLPWRQYVSEPGFAAYFLNILGFIHYALPGVFQGAVLNAQLWTIPAELYCYVMLVVAALLGLVKRPRLLLVVLVVGLGLQAVLSGAEAQAAGYDLTRPFSGRLLVFAFLAGVLMWLLRAHVPVSIHGVILALGLSIVSLNDPRFGALAMMPVAYLTVVMGVQSWRPLPVGDTSYGIYLYHFPVARTLHELSGHALNWPTLLAGTLGVSIVLAYLSMGLVERPIQRHKRVLVGAWVDRLFRWPARARQVRPAR